MFTGRCEGCQQGPRCTWGGMSPVGWVRVGRPMQGMPEVLLGMQGRGWACGGQVLREKGTIPLMWDWGLG